MSHYTLTVLLPGQIGVPTRDEDADGFLSEVMARYEEEPFYSDDPREKARVIAPKWDWYVIGGRWAGALPIADSSTNWRDIVEPSRRKSSFFDEPADMPPAGYCDGGRLYALDLARLRDEKGAKAEKDWNEYAAVILGTPQPRYWKTFSDRIQASELEILGSSWQQAVRDVYAAVRAERGLPVDEEAFDAWIDEEDNDFYDGPEYKAYDAAIRSRIDGLRDKLKAEGHYDIDQARADYHAQPRVRAVKAAEVYQQWFLDDPIDEFDRYTRDEYIEIRRASAVPGFATLYVTSDDPDCRRFETQWIAPGEMGWFAMSTDTDDSRAYYHKRVNALIDSLEDDYVLVQLDCHI